MLSGRTVITQSTSEEWPTRHDALQALRAESTHGRVCVYCGWEATRYLPLRGEEIDLCNICAEVRALMMYRRDRPDVDMESWQERMAADPDYGSRPDGRPIDGPRPSHLIDWQVGSVFTCHYCAGMATVPAGLAGRPATCPACESARREGRGR